MKMQGKIFKLLPGSLYVRSLLHGIICIKMSQPGSKHFHHVLSFSGHLLINNCSTVPEKTGNKISETSHAYLWVDIGVLIEKLLLFTDDLDLSRSQPYKITFWAISQFLLDKLSPNFKTA